MRLSDIAPLDPARDGEEIARADLTDLAAVEAAMRGVDCVVHLGAVPGDDLGVVRLGWWRPAAGTRGAILAFHTLG